MATEDRPKNRDGTSISGTEYAALILAVLVPFVGLCFGIYMRYDGNPFGNRVIGLSIVAAAIWLFLVLR